MRKLQSSGHEGAKLRTDWPVRPSGWFSWLVVRVNSRNKPSVWSLPNGTFGRDGQPGPGKRHGPEGAFRGAMPVRDRSRSGLPERVKGLTASGRSCQGVDVRRVSVGKIRLVLVTAGVLGCDQIVVGALTVRLIGNLREANKRIFKIFLNGFPSTVSAFKKECFGRCERGSWFQKDLPARPPFPGAFQSQLTGAFPHIAFLPSP